MTGYKRITKDMFYHLGGFADSKNVRKHNGKSWQYYRQNSTGFETTLTWEQI